MSSRLSGPNVTLLLHTAMVLYAICLLHAQVSGLGDIAEVVGEDDDSFDGDFSDVEDTLPATNDDDSFDDDDDGPVIVYESGHVQGCRVCVRLVGSLSTTCLQYPHPNFAACLCVCLRADTIAAQTTTTTTALTTMRL